MAAVIGGVPGGDGQRLERLVRIKGGTAMRMLARVRLGKMVGLGVALMVGVVFGGVGGHMLNAQQAEKKTPLLKAALTGAPGQEAYVVLHEMPAGGVEEKHYHNGDVFLYMLEGSETLEIPGQAPVTVKAGQTLHLAPKVVVTPKNGSMTAAAKFITFAVVPAGQPVAVEVK